MHQLNLKTFDLLYVVYNYIIPMKQKLIRVTPDYVIDRYLDAKKLKGDKKEKAMQHVIFLSKNLHKYVEDQTSK